MQQLGVKIAKSCIFRELAPKIRHEKAVLHGKRLVTGFSGRSLTPLPPSSEVRTATYSKLNSS